jgi:hypothetical protein
VNKTMRDFDACYQMIINNPVLLLRWSSTHVLLVDEGMILTADLLVSYMEKDYFCLLHALGQTIRLSKHLFGGMLIIFTGDFMQLAGAKGESQFAFLSPTWKMAVADGRFLLKNLTIPHRQKDPIFRNILTELRFGILSKSTIDALKSRVDDSFTNNPNDWISEFYALKKSVEESNIKQMSTLKGEINTYLAVDTGSNPNLSKLCPAPPLLSVKVGSRVMALVNTPEYSNGSMGYVSAAGRGSVSVRFDHSPGKTSVLVPFLFRTLNLLTGRDDTRLQV